MLASLTFLNLASLPLTVSTRDTPLTALDLMGTSLRWDVLVDMALFGGDFEPDNTVADDRNVNEPTPDAAAIETVLASAKQPEALTGDDIVAIKEREYVIASTAFRESATALSVATDEHYRRLEVRIMNSFRFKAGMRTSTLEKVDDELDPVADIFQFLSLVKAMMPYHRRYFTNLAESKAFLACHSHMLALANGHKTEFLILQVLVHNVVRSAQDFIRLSNKPRGPPIDEAADSLMDLRSTVEGVAGVTPEQFKSHVKALVVGSSLRLRRLFVSFPVARDPRIDAFLRAFPNFWRRRSHFADCTVVADALEKVQKSEMEKKRVMALINEAADDDARIEVIDLVGLSLADLHREATAMINVIDRVDKDSLGFKMFMGEMQKLTVKDFKDHFSYVCSGIMKHIDHRGQNQGRHVKRISNFATVLEKVNHIKDGLFKDRDVLAAYDRAFTDMTSSKYLVDAFIAAPRGELVFMVSKMIARYLKSIEELIKAYNKALNLDSVGDETQMKRPRVDSIASPVTISIPQPSVEPFELAPHPSHGCHPQPLFNERDLADLVNQLPPE